MIQTNQLAEIPVEARDDTRPRQSARAVRLPVDFSQASSFTFDFGPLKARKSFNSVECVYVDNSQGSQVVVLRSEGIGQTLYVEPGTYGYFDLLFTDPAILTVSSAGSGNVQVFVLNVKRQGSWTIPGSSPGSESVTVLNWPATQPVSGSVSVSNFPATQPVSVAATVATQDVTDGTPGSAIPSKAQLIAGSDGTLLRALATDTSGNAKVAVQNFPGTQPVSGSVSVSNFPASQVTTDTATSAIAALIANGALKVSLTGSNGAMILPTRTVSTATDTALITDYLIECNATSNNIAETLPATFTSVQTLALVIVKTDSSSHTVTVSCSASIGGAGSWILSTQNDRIGVLWDGATWRITDLFIGTAGIIPGSVGINTAPRKQLSIDNNLDLYVSSSGSPSTPSIRAFGNALTVQSYSTQALYLNFDGGTGGVSFCNGAAGVVGSVDASGNASFNGGLTVQNGANVSFGSNFQSFTVTPIGGITYTGLSVGAALYMRVGPMVLVHFSMSLTPTSVGLYLTMTLPISTPAGDFGSASFVALAGVYGSNTATGQSWVPLVALMAPSSSTVTIYAGGNTATNFQTAGAASISGSFWYKCA